MPEIPDFDQMAELAAATSSDLLLLTASTDAFGRACNAAAESVMALSVTWRNVLNQWLDSLTPPGRWMAYLLHYVCRFHWLETMQIVDDLPLATKP